MSEQTQEASLRDHTMPESQGEEQRSPSAVACKGCGSRRMRRLPREGFLQKQILTLLGYYPWECPICRSTQYFRVRGKRSRKRPEWTEASEKY
jgi:hypothetical protein